MELLNEHRRRELIAQPESGMGYQDVAIELRNGETRHGTAFNAEFLLYSGEPPHALEKISEPGQRSLMLERKEVGLGEEILSLKVLQIEADVSTRVRESSSSTKSSSGQVMRQKKSYKKRKNLNASLLTRTTAA